MINCIIKYMIHLSRSFPLVVQSLFIEDYGRLSRLLFQFTSFGLTFWLLPFAPFIPSSLHPFPLCSLHPFPLCSLHPFIPSSLAPLLPSSVVGSSAIVTPRQMKIFF